MTICKAVFETLESDELAYGPQAGLAARHIRALQRRLDQLVREQEAARRSALAQGTRAKLAELAIEAAALELSALTRSARSWPSSSSGRSPAEAQARRKAQGGRWLIPRTLTAPMAFNPRTDVVLEVLSAADPSRASLAAQRLSALAGSNAPASRLCRRPRPRGELCDGDRQRRSRTRPTRARASPRSPGGPDKLGQAKTQFEAMMLNSFVGELLAEGRKRASSVREWPATCGDRCSPSRCRCRSPSPASSASPGACSPPTSSAPAAGRRIRAKRRRPPASAAQMSANILSAPAGAELDNGAVLFAGRKRT